MMWLHFVACCAIISRIIQVFERGTLMKRRVFSVILIISLIFSMLAISASADDISSPVFEGTLRTSTKGIEMLKELEGFIEHPWHDVSQYSIGYGCSTTYASKYGFSTDYLTKDEAHQLMLFVLDEMETYLDTFLSTYDITVNQYQYDALMSLTYNIGRGWIGPNTRIGKLLVNGNYTVNEMASAFGIYCHTGTGVNAVVQDHLVSRRIQEAKLFLYGAYKLSDADEKFCRLTYYGNVPPDYSDVALYQQGEPYQVLFEPDYRDSDGRYFIGWYTASGEKLTADVVVTEARLTVYPQWSYYEEDPELEIPADYYISPTSPALTQKTYVKGICGEETLVDGSTSNSPEDEIVYELDASKDFKDISTDDWYFEYVNALYNEKVIEGYEDHTFRPERTVTTGEALKMILLAAGYAEPEMVTQHWASGYHYLALEWGIIERGDIVDLDVPITREMMAKVAANALELERLYDGAVYIDTDNKYACALYDWGITEGYEDGSFRLNRSLTRAELSAIVWRINKYF